MLKWVVENCPLLDGQKRTVIHAFITSHVIAGRMGSLDYLLRSTHVLDVDWPQDLVCIATQYGQISVIRWWDRNQDALPAQDLTFPWSLLEAIRQDAVTVLAWWHARGIPVSRRDWQGVCVNAISEYASHVLAWIRDHQTLFAPVPDPDKKWFIDVCTDTLLRRQNNPHTLDFVDVILPDLKLPPLPGNAYLNLPTLLGGPTASMVLLSRHFCRCHRVFSDRCSTRPTSVRQNGGCRRTSLSATRSFFPPHSSWPKFATRAKAHATGCLTWL
ncbi:hypothetical protein BC828DRAFT_391825 [Blastocladiella britannica]|nr:hypothetical protein BC828DRAFT_391825 [Blastocladiella britannica]